MYQTSQLLLEDEEVDLTPLPQLASDREQDIVPSSSWLLVLLFHTFKHG